MKVSDQSTVFEELAYSQTVKVHQWQGGAKKTAALSNGWIPFQFMIVYKKM